MLNMIKMDLYRMFRTKSMYVVWIVLAVSVLFTTFMCKTDYDLLSKEDTVRQEQFAEPTAENINVGMMVTLPTEPGEKVTVYDIFFANSQGKFYALFLVIFAVMFSTADIGSGYIKNIGGQVQKRGTLIFSRSIALAVFTVSSACARAAGMSSFRFWFALLIEVSFPCLAFSTFLNASMTSVVGGSAS